MVGKLYWLIQIVVSPLIFLFKPLTLNHLKRYSDPSEHSYTEMLPYMDRSFYNNGKCVGCGSCAKICPVVNIEIVIIIQNGCITANFAWLVFIGAPKKLLKVKN